MPTENEKCYKNSVFSKTASFLEAGDLSLNPCTGRTLPKYREPFPDVSQTDLAERSGLVVRAELFPLGTVWQL